MEVCHLIIWLFVCADFRILFTSVVLPSCRLTSDLLAKKLLRRREYLARLYRVIPSPSHSPWRWSLLASCRSPTLLFGSRCFCIHEHLRPFAWLRPELVSHSASGSTVFSPPGTSRQRPPVNMNVSSWSSRKCQKAILDCRVPHAELGNTLAGPPTQINACTCHYWSPVFEETLKLPGRLMVLHCGP